jgi:hypothetical protein
MYTTYNFKTKKQLKEAVKEFNDIMNMANAGIPAPVAHPVRFYQPGTFGGNEPTDGTICLEGPHYPAPHTWYAQATVKNGIVVAVK